MTRPVLGLDIGGSKTHALVVDGAVTTGAATTAECKVGSANLASVGRQAAEAALDELMSALRGGLGGFDVADVEAVCAGAAGADTADGRARLSALLEPRFPRARIEVFHDTRIILAAAGLETGTVIISGTGSVAWGRRSDGQEARAGGWGYLLGDEGSGYAVAREAVRNALAEVDTASPSGELTKRLLTAVGLEHAWQLLDRFYADPERKYWAGRAGIVFDLAAEGDPVSQSIVESAATALAGLAATVNQRLGLRGPVVLAGGLAVHQRALGARIEELLDERGTADIRVVDRDPVWGAVELARGLLADRPSAAPTGPAAAAPAGTTPAGTTPAGATPAGTTPAGTTSAGTTQTSTTTTSSKEHP